MGGRDALPEELNICFALMQRWVQVAIHECRAEFPEFDLLFSFRVFDVTGGHAPAMFNDAFQDPDIIKHLQRLALLVGLPEADVIEQYKTALHIMEHEFRFFGKGDAGHRKHSDDNVLVWRKFYKKMVERRRRSRFAALHAMLLRWRGYRLSSTSGVEQKFTKTMARMSCRQGSASFFYEEALVRLIMDSGALDRTKLIAGAQQFWVHRGYGQPRASGSRGCFSAAPQGVHCTDGGLS